MSRLRREQLVRVARSYDALVITDDVYDQLLWSTDPDASHTGIERAILPRVVDIDRDLEGGQEGKVQMALATRSATAASARLWVQAVGRDGRRAHRDLHGGFRNVDPASLEAHHHNWLRHLWHTCYSQAHSRTTYRRFCSQLMHGVTKFSCPPLKSI